MDKKVLKLDSYEQSIEDSLEEYVTVENEEEMKRSLVEAAKAHRVSVQSIIIDVPTNDFESMKCKAHKQGMSYPSYINMLIHNDAASSRHDI